MKVKLKIKFGFFAVLLLLVLAISSPDYFPALLCSAALHELGHIAMARACGIRLICLKLGIFGAALSPESSLYSYKKEIILCLGGPAFNFLTALTARNFFLAAPNAEIFIASSLALGTLNLLPITDFDGGRAVNAVLCSVLSVDTAARLMRAVSFIFIFSLWCCSLYLLLRAGASLTLFVFSAALFSKIFILKGNQSF